MSFPRRCHTPDEDGFSNRSQLRAKLNMDQIKLGFDARVLVGISATVNASQQIKIKRFVSAAYHLFRMPVTDFRSFVRFDSSDIQNKKGRSWLATDAGCDLSVEKILKINKI